MNEEIKIATRQSYGETLEKLGEKNKNIVELLSMVFNWRC